MAARPELKRVDLFDEQRQYIIWDTFEIPDDISLTEIKNATEEHVDILARTVGTLSLLASCEAISENLDQDLNFHINDTVFTGASLRRWLDVMSETPFSVIVRSANDSRRVEERELPLSQIIPKEIIDITLLLGLYTRYSVLETKYGPDYQLSGKNKTRVKWAKSSIVEAVGGVSEDDELVITVEKVMASIESNPILWDLAAFPTIGPEGEAIDNYSDWIDVWLKAAEEKGIDFTNDMVTRFQDYLYGSLTTDELGEQALRSLGLLRQDNDFEVEQDHIANVCLEGVREQTRSLNVQTLIGVLINTIQNNARDSQGRPLERPGQVRSWISNSFKKFVNEGRK